jgi:hypothetical protein
MLLKVALLAVAESHPDAKGHESEGWNQEHHNAFADGSLSILEVAFAVL